MSRAGRSAKNIKFVSAARNREPVALWGTTRRRLEPSGVGTVISQGGVGIRHGSFEGESGLQGAGGGPQGFDTP